MSEEHNQIDKQALIEFNEISTEQAKVTSMQVHVFDDARKRWNQVIAVIANIPSTKMRVVSFTGYIQFTTILFEQDYLSLLRQQMKYYGHTPIAIDIIENIAQKLISAHDNHEGE